MSEEGPVLATAPFLLPPPPIGQSLIAEALVAEPTILPPSYFEDIHPPPPRRPLA